MAEEGGPGRDRAAARGRLQARRRDLAALRRGLRQGGGLSGSQGQVLSELSTYDNHPADLGTDMWQRGQAVGMDADLSGQLREVDDALRRLAAGTYGRCEDCGGAVPAERLAALPEARRCVACQGRRDREAAAGVGEMRAEEAVLAPPFGRSNRDGTDTVEFDGEDAWQDVARYGTSNTPSDVPGSREYPVVVEDKWERHGAVEDVENAVAADGEPVGGVWEDDSL